MGLEDEIAHLNTRDFTSPTKDEYQQAFEPMGALEHIELKYEDDSPWKDVPVAAKVHNDFFDKHLPSIGEMFPDEDFRENGYDDIVAEISFDLSNEFEKATGVNLGLVAAHKEREMIDRLQQEAVPDGTGLYRVGHVPGFMHPDFDDYFDRQAFETDGYPTEDESLDYMTQKRRYIDHLKSHGLDVMSIGGTDSIQVTMRPLVEDAADEPTDALEATYGEGYTPADAAVDDMFREFYGGGEHTSISALSPLLFAPFMASPVFDEDGELVEHMGREWAYEHGLGSSEYVDTDGTRKWGYIPEMADAEGTEDMLDVFADKQFQFSAEVAADSDHLTVKGTDRTLYEAFGDDHPHLDPDAGVNIRVGHDDYGPIDFKEFADTRRFEGIVSLPSTDENGDGDEVVVEVDYSSLPDETDAEDEEGFYDVAWNHFIAHSSGVWPSYRPRWNSGAMESRDYGNSPRIQEAIDTQAATYLQWEELQEYADRELDMWEGYADIVRDGIAEEGLTYELPSGDTVREAWLGTGKDRGLLDILAEGVAAAAYGNGNVPAEEREAYADAYREQMVEYLEDGTYADVFAETLAAGGLDAAMRKTEMNARETPMVDQR